MLGWKPQDELPEEEIAERVDRVVRRMIATRPKPQQPKSRKTAKKPSIPKKVPRQS